MKKIKLYNGADSYLQIEGLKDRIVLFPSRFFYRKTKESYSLYDYNKLQPLLSDPIGTVFYEIYKMGFIWLGWEFKLVYETKHKNQ